MAERYWLPLSVFGCASTFLVFTLGVFKMTKALEP
jgi:hypothetical protein